MEGFQPKFKRRTRAQSQLEWAQREERLKRLCSATTTTTTLNKERTKEIAAQPPQENSAEAPISNKVPVSPETYTAITTSRRTRSAKAIAIAQVEVGSSFEHYSGSENTSYHRKRTESMSMSVSSLGMTLMTTQVSVPETGTGPGDTDRTPIKKTFPSPPQLQRVPLSTAVENSISIDLPKKTDIPHVPVVPEASLPPIAPVPLIKQEENVSAITPDSPSAAVTTAAVTALSNTSVPCTGTASLVTRRMISFSPESKRIPGNPLIEKLRLEKHIKETGKLQLRMEGSSLAAAASSTTTTTAVSNESRTAEAKKEPQKEAEPEQKMSQTLDALHVEVPSMVENNSQEDNGTVTFSFQPAASQSSSTSHCSYSQSTEHLPLSQSAAETADFTNTPVKTPSATTVATKTPSNRTPQALSSIKKRTAVQRTHTDLGTVDFAFTSTSIIEDVGLFNCERDVEYTGGVYGEGTDGKVSAGVIKGQKIALKRAKPHEGFPEEEAKRRSVIELHYLRRVRHFPGFLQCLGLCDGIEHTCIALEVMDCKLSDYLRKYGVKRPSINTTGGNSSSGSSTRSHATLSVEQTRMILKQICQPMMVLHDQINVAHGDLACRNILIRTPPKGYEAKWEPVVKLSDFGRIKFPSSEPKILEESFSFYKNCDIGSFGREILYRLLVGETIPANHLESRSLHKFLQDTVVTNIPETAKNFLGPFYRLFQRCTAWGVRPSFREIYNHLDDLDYFETTENGLFPLKPNNGIPMTPNVTSTSQTPNSSYAPTTGPSSLINTSAALNVEASFLSPIGMDGSKGKKMLLGSSTKITGVAAAGGNKFETPTGKYGKLASSSRLLSSKSFTEGSNTAYVSTAATTPVGPVAITTPGSNQKAVHWLKARSVHSGAYTSRGSGAKTNGNIKSRPGVLVKQQPVTTNNKKDTNSTPGGGSGGGGGGGASRRSLQILNKITQHRIEKGKKKNI